MAAQKPKSNGRAKRSADQGMEASSTKRLKVERRTLNKAQIAQMFEDFRLGTDEARGKFKQLELLGNTETIPQTFIRLDDTSLVRDKEESRAELA